LSLISVYSGAQQRNYISLNQQTEILENKKKIGNNVDLFLDNNKLVLTKYYHSPSEFIMVSNSLGEIKTYYPASNEVAYKQIAELSSKRNLIYYFANNLTSDLGLVDEGFVLSSNTYENQYNVTLWKAPNILKGIEAVKMVFEDGLPVFSEYQGNKKEILKKIYYTNYQDYSQFRIPLKIIEINYMPSGDSIINRTLFTNVKVSTKPESNYFNFKIPENAKAISTIKER
jgi:hypothetical protein